MQSNAGMLRSSYYLPFMHMLVNVMDPGKLFQ